jgi:hypothetical protein
MTVEAKKQISCEWDSCGFRNLRSGGALALRLAEEIHFDTSESFPCLRCQAPVSDVPEIGCGAVPFQAVDITSMQKHIREID